ncbi:ABC1 family-domain-containing protein [Crucibulum laeve]|uniref:ABC1 family-domain-containing protein n=1 Tax=Crucibulum laeve TaxID=68775 RepID=A0A5C3M401_9AGAR|nr:ABC1 family-domain-containing protein [Crucibulum laeve]
MVVSLLRVSLTSSNPPLWTRGSSLRGLSSSAVTRPTPSRAGRYTRRIGYLAVGLGTVWAVDKTYNASAITRNLRTLWTCAAITLDYKWNFTPGKSELIPELHERVANRVYNLLTSNGGLYIKIGQAIGANAALLPKPMQVKFATLFDDAPQIPYSVVHDVFVSELGQPPSGPGGVFEIFEEKAVASASIAQVHKAKLWPKIGPDGQPEKEEHWVAVKVQKPAVGKQMEWDLAAYRAVMWMFENWAFDLPVYFAVDFISDHLRQELDFEREADNARQTAAFVAQEPRLRDKVHIPIVYPEYSTKKVMTAEWIDGVRLSDRSGIRRLMGEREPDSSNSRPSFPSDSPAVVLSETIPSHVTSVLSSPSQLKMPDKPLKGGVKAIMQTMVELFSAQMFDWGWVHCDPHPGNVLVRPSPKDPRHPQLVLLDHGLYVRVPEGFRREWVSLWRGMLSGDFKEVEKVTNAWGMGMPDLLASFTLMKPVILRRGRKQKSKEEREKEEKERKPMTQYEMSVKMKEKLKGFLTDTDRMPKVLIFLTRNMRMVQGNNQSFGSPVNRIKITGYWASRSQISNRNLSVGERVHEWWHHLVFISVMFSLDIAFWKSRFLLWFWGWRRKWHLGGTERRGSFEDELEKNMRGFAKDSLGIDVGEGVFAG